MLLSQNEDLEQAFSVYQSNKEVLLKEVEERGQRLEQEQQEKEDMKKVGCEPGFREKCCVVRWSNSGMCVSDKETVGETLRRCDLMLGDVYLHKAVLNTHADDEGVCSHGEGEV